MDRLVDGFRRFRASYYIENRELFEELARGQRPRAMIIACSDSRVDPQMLFGTGPGEIFVVRNVANLVPPYAPNADYHGTSAALEFGIRSLKVEHLIVLGHSSCGGIGALLRGDGEKSQDFVLPWMQIAAKAREDALALSGDDPGKAQHACELEGIKLSLRNLLSFPWLRERVESGELTLHGWYFDLEHGALLRLDKDGNFKSA